MEIFNTHLEFNSNRLYEIIDSHINNAIKGYVCICDSSVLTRIHNDLSYRKIINKAFINSCDGSSICTMAKFIYGGNLESVNGPEIFSKYITLQYKQVILGNTTNIVQKVRSKLHSLSVNDSYVSHIQLPFCNVDDFNYKEIAEEINRHKYDIIWVSLGNPKQEIFMNKILPYLNTGVMFGIGAALNFWVGDLSLPKFQIGSLRFIWLTRIFEDPIRQLKMNWPIIKAIPKIFLEEKRKSIL